MKKTSTITGIKALTLALIAMIIPFINSCTKEKTDVTDLLSTVPSSSGGVIGINLSSILEKAGCNIDGAQIKPGKELEKWLASRPDDSKDGIAALLNGDTGIDPMGAIVFNDAGRFFLTFSLADPDRFCAYIGNKSHIPFSTEGDVKVAGMVAVRGSQAWICLTPGRMIDPHAISAYASLNKSQSFLENKFSEDIANMSDDIIGWGQIKTLIKGYMSFGELSAFNMVTGMLFEDATALSFKLDFKKGECESSLVILNDKGKPAKYLLPSDKIDDDVLKTLGETCKGMAAFTVTPKLVDKLAKLGSSLGGSLLGDLKEYLKNVDGTVGVVLGDNPAANSNTPMNCVITTKGPVSLELKSFLAEWLGPVKEDGKYLRASSGDVNGPLSVLECADELDGALMGAVLDYNKLAESSGIAPSKTFKSFIFKLEPESDGVELEFKLNSFNEKENILLSLIKENNLNL